VTSLPELSDDEHQVVGALLSLSRVFSAVTARELGGLDEEVTLPQFRTLVVLVSRGPQRVGDLAQELTVTSSTAVRMCNRLVRKGLVEREERPEDRRAAWITLTRPLAFASTLTALVEAAGEVSDAHWWRLWSNSVGQRA
jgi:hypothetical protein